MELMDSPSLPHAQGAESPMESIVPDRSPEDGQQEPHQRGHWADISIMRLKRPDVINPIVHMLGLSRPIREIAKVNRVTNGTVLAVLNDPAYKPKIQAQREHFTTQARNALRLGIEAKVDEYADPKCKPPPMFDLHLLHQMVTLEEGGATSRMEHTFVPADTQASADLMRMVDIATRNTGPSNGAPRLEENGFTEAEYSIPIALPAPSPAPPTLETEPSSGADSEQGQVMC